MTKIIPRVSKRDLVFIAGLVWCIAGYNILSLGVPYVINSLNRTILPILTSIIIFLIFFKLIFFKLVEKHTRRIKSYPEERVRFYKFFDGKSYLIMVFMISFGIVLRSSHILPYICLGTLYAGLGSALAMAGLLFLVHFLVDKY